MKVSLHGIGLIISLSGYKICKNRLVSPCINLVDELDNSRCRQWEFNRIPTAAGELTAHSAVRV